MKRFFDLTVSILLLLVLAPLFIIISLMILFDSRGGIFYLQHRVGLHNIDFKIFKFRTMYSGSDKKGLLTVGGKDNRITKTGFLLRKYKLDELPQLLNVLLGEMSLVGPRPEVRKYVNLYSAEQKKVLEVKPGITDYASVLYSNENELLGKSADPEKDYIEQIMPAKLELNMKYIREISMITDLKIIGSTLVRILSSH